MGAHGLAVALSVRCFMLDGEAIAALDKYTWRSPAARVDPFGFRSNPNELYHGTWLRWGEESANDMPPQVSDLHITRYSPMCA
jgi:hypothetical protein